MDAISADVDSTILTVVESGSVETRESCGTPRPENEGAEDAHSILAGEADAKPCRPRVHDDNHFCLVSRVSNLCVEMMALVSIQESVVKNECNIAESRVSEKGLVELFSLSLCIHRL